MCLACEMDALWFAEMEAARASSPLPVGERSASSVSETAGEGLSASPWSENPSPAALRPSTSPQRGGPPAGPGVRSEETGAQMSELTSLTLSDARDLLRKREFSAVELTKAHVAAIREARALNAFVLETPEQAHEMAARADGALAKGEGGPLAGVPLGVKDMFATKGVRTTACSHMLDTFVPTYESAVTANLWRDGAVMLGKLNNDEFAMRSSHETSYFRPRESPWRVRARDATAVQGGP